MNVKLNEQNETIEALKQEINKLNMKLFLEWWNDDQRNGRKTTFLKKKMLGKISKYSKKRFYA